MTEPRKPAGRTETIRAESVAVRARPPAFLNEALGYLTGEGRRQSADALLQQLYARFRVAGNEKLADLVYEMVKACLSALPDFSVRTRLLVEPRRAEVIAGEVSIMADCLRGVAPPPDLSTLARSRPEADAALDDARKCLEILRVLEGTSGREQLALALYLIHAGRHAQAEALVRQLLERPDEPEPIHRLAEVNLAFALLRQGRFAEVVPVAEAAIARAPQDPVPWFNLLAALAELGNAPRFERAAESFRAQHARPASPLVAAWIANDLAMLAEVAGLTQTRIAALCAPPRGSEDVS
jgi:tetratricopeptide (TPR) repeat protein